MCYSGDHKYYPIKQIICIGGRVYEYQICQCGKSVNMDGKKLSIEELINEATKKETWPFV